MSAPSVVAIDGPAGSGKSTLARGLAELLGKPYVNTGAMYRAVTALAIHRGVPTDDAGALVSLASELRFTVDLARVPPALSVEGVDERELSRPEVEEDVSTVAAHPEVRAVLRAEQRAIGERWGAVMEGRDIGSVVFPDAPVKIYLDAGLAIRATRRAGDRRVTPETAGERLGDRDRRDARTTPLAPAADAVVIRTAGATIDQTLQRALEVVRREAPELAP